jgi:hypothetical protein
MIRLATPQLRIVHALPGRIRVHVPRLSAAPHAAVQGALSRLRRLAGVRRVSASSVTGNVLVTYDPDSLDEGLLLAALGGERPGATASAARTPAPRRVERPTLLRAAAGILPLLPLARRWLAAVLGPRPAALLSLLPAALGLARSILAGGGPLGWTLAALDAVQLAVDVGGVLRAA